MPSMNISENASCDKRKHFPCSVTENYQNAWTHCYCIHDLSFDRSKYLLDVTNIGVLLWSHSGVGSYHSALDCSMSLFSRIFIRSLDERIESREDWMPAQNERLTG